MDLNVYYIWGSKFVFNITAILSETEIVHVVDEKDDSGDVDTQSTYEFRKLFCQMDRLHHFKDGDMEWRESARFVLISNQYSQCFRHLMTYYSPLHCLSIKVGEIRRMC